MLNITPQEISGNKERILCVEGRLDTTTAPLLEEYITEDALAVIETLTLDFSGLEYLSSAGLRVLLKAQKIMNKVENGKMIVKNVNESIMDIFDVTGFIDILTIK